MGVFWELPRTFLTPKNAQNAEVKRQSGAVPIPLLALLALTTSANSSLGVSRELNPRPQLLKASVSPLSSSECMIHTRRVAGFRTLPQVYPLGQK
jgi:hypothetical protein